MSHEIDAHEISSPDRFGELLGLTNQIWLAHKRPDNSKSIKVFQKALEPALDEGAPQYYAAVSLWLKSVQCWLENASDFITVGDG